MEKRPCSKDKEKLKENCYFHYIKKVQSLESIPNEYSTQSVNINRSIHFK